MPALYSEYTRYIEAEILALKTAALAAMEAKASEGKEEGKGGDNYGKENDVYDSFVLIFLRVSIL